MLTFKGSEHLLRASRLAHLTRNLGQILTSSAGSAASYQLSEQVVNMIDVFISHNWSVGRVPKFLTLAFEFNFDLAVCVTAAFSVPVGVGCYYCITKVDTSFAPEPMPSNFLARLVMVPMFFIVLLFIRDCWGFRHSGPNSFFDKVCIHQEDRELQLAGILKLGAFIKESRRMVVLYTKVYLSKLWTVYEVACFLSVHDATRLTIVPVPMAIVYFIGVLGVWSWNLTGCAVYVIGPWLQNVLAFLVLFPYGVCLRQWLRDKAYLLEHLEHFEVRSCICAVEADREVVYRNIASLMRAAHDMPAGASEDEALDAFNVMVRTELLQPIRATLGRFAFEYKHYLFLASAATVPRSMDALEGFLDGTPPLLFIAHYIRLVFWTFCGWPLFAVFYEVCVERQLALRGLREVCWLMIPVTCSVMLATIMDVSLELARDMASESVAAVLVFAAAVLVASGASVWIGLRPCSGWFGKGAADTPATPATNGVARVATTTEETPAAAGMPEAAGELSEQELTDAELDGKTKEDVAIEASQASLPAATTVDPHADVDVPRTSLPGPVDRASSFSETVYAV